MDWIQFILFLLAVLGMLYSMKTDSQRDRDRASEDRKDILKLVRTMESENRTIVESIKTEMKDFHGRLCTLEERYLQIIQQKLTK